MQCPEHVGISDPEVGEQERLVSAREPGPPGGALAVLAAQAQDRAHHSSRRADEKPWAAWTSASLSAHESAQPSAEKHADESAENGT